jgi:hypothetical protein
MPKVPPATLSTSARRSRSAWRLPVDSGAIGQDHRRPTRPADRHAPRHLRRPLDSSPVRRARRVLRRSPARSSRCRNSSPILPCTRTTSQSPTQSLTGGATTSPAPRPPSLYPSTIRVRRSRAPRARPSCPASRHHRGRAGSAGPAAPFVTLHGGDGGLRDPHQPGQRYR